MYAFVANGKYILHITEDAHDTLDVFLGCSLLTGKPLIFTKTKSFIND